MSNFFKEANEQRRNSGMHGLIEIIEAEWRDKLKAAVLEEREACAKVCEETHYTGFGYEPIAPRQAAAIRARGQA